VAGGDEYEDDQNAIKVGLFKKNRTHNCQLWWD